MAILDIQITNSSMKEIQGSLGATLTEASWISTSYLVAEMIAIPLSGWLSKGLSTRRYLLWSTGLFIVSSLLCSTAWNLESMVIYRAFQGFFGGALIPLSFRLILECLPHDKRAVGMALFGVTATFAPSIGPTIGGWLTENMSWHYIFYINLPPGLVVLSMLAYGLANKPIDWGVIKQADVMGIITMAIGLGCLEVVLEDGNRQDWFGSAHIRDLAIISLVSLTLFVIIQLRKKAPLVNLRLFGNRNFILSSIAYFLLGLGLLGAIYLIPLYLSQVHDYSPMQIGSVIMWIGFPQLVVLPFVPKILKKVDGRYLAALGFGLFAISYLMNSQMTIDYGGSEMIFSQVVRAIGQPLVMVPISIIATAHLLPSQNADASTLLSLMRNLGGAFGIALVATLSDNLARMHLAHIKESVPAVSVLASEYLQQAEGAVLAMGSSSVEASQQAQAILAQQMSAQAYMQAYNQVFFILGILLFIAVICVLGIHNGKLQNK